jgi:hypothetical protein
MEMVVTSDNEMASATGMIKTTGITRAPRTMSGTEMIKAASMMRGQLELRELFWIDEWY